MKYSQIHRFLLIDRLLYLNTEGISTKDMLERINASLKEEGCPPITLRQLQNDINDMKDVLNAPIDSGRGQRRIKYSEVNFCIFNKTHEPYKISAIEDAFSGRLNWLRLQMDYMQESFYNEKMLEVIDYEDNMQLTNIEELPIILKAITKERLIHFQYAKKFSTERESRTVHPYFLHQYNNRWYLFALFRAKDNTIVQKSKDSVKDGMRCYALDRMSDISIVGGHSPAYENKTVQEIRAYKRKYFSHIVGVMNDGRGDIQDLDLIFEYGKGDDGRKEEVKLFYNLLKSNPFYDGFEFDDDDGAGYVKAKLCLNHELENHLMMFAHTAYISNETVRKSIIQRAHQILATQHAAHQPK